MKAVILAGGKGTRLAPYTTILPKPLMPLGDMPVLEIIVRQLKAHGITDITLAVGHLASLITAYFGDGERWGVRIRYSYEPKPLGTGGPLALIPELKEDAFLVLNGDLVTDLDYSAMVNAHRTSGAEATVGAFVRDVRIGLGVMNVDARSRITKYTEKPSFTYLASMGVYVLNPVALSLVPEERFDLPDLVAALLAAGKTVAAYTHAGYWLDIGQPDDYRAALEDLQSGRVRLLADMTDER